MSDATFRAILVAGCLLLPVLVYHRIRSQATGERLDRRQEGWFILGCLLVWTLVNLGRNLTDTVVTRKAHALVTSGPYRWLRHPFYASTALSVTANGLVAANWFLLAAGWLTVVLLVIRTRREEEVLVARFGDAYRSYMDRTGRFLPRAH